MRLPQFYMQLASPTNISFVYKLLAEGAFPAIMLLSVNKKYRSSMQEKDFVPSHPRVPAKLTYELARELASDSDLKVRKALAEHPDAPPEILYFLAKDEDIDIRRAVACNANAPRQADLLLTSDEAPEVRHELANKITRITPDLTADKRQAVYDVTVQVLEALAGDQVARVRAILADAIKELPDAPKPLMRQLALDTELIVAEPVLQFSPVFNDEDLADIIKSKPVQGAVSAISKRANVSEGLSDAIVESGDKDAITHLLDNPKAAISENTMDHILDQAEEVEDWHAPLIARPKLSANAAQRLASFVAMTLLDQLQERNDLDDDTLVALTQSVETRLADEAKRAKAEEQKEDAEEAEEEEEDEEDDGWDSDDADLQEVETLHQVGGLDAEAIEEAFDAGRKKFVLGAVSLLSGTSFRLVSRLFGLPKPREITALCWKAKLSPHFARRIQLQYARIQQSKIIAPRADGGYALSDAELKKIIKQIES